jgi:S1-C subfamily serine protease
MSGSILCAACGRSQPVIAGRAPTYCSGCGAILPPTPVPAQAAVVPPPLAPIERAAATAPQPAHHRLAGHFVVLAVACSLLLSLLSVGLAAMFVWQRTPSQTRQAAADKLDDSAPAALEKRPAASPFAMVTDLASATTPGAAEPTPDDASRMAPSSRTTFRPLTTTTEIEPAEQTPKHSIELADLIETIESSVVRVNVSGPNGGGLGSGFIADADGTVVTNHHVIEGAASAEVMFKDGRKARVRGVRADLADKDLAVLAIEPIGRPLRPLKIATQLPRKGEQVVAFGAPLGFSFTASDGLISAIRNGAELNAEFRSLGFNLDYDSHVTWLQTTAPISRGNSGGPLVNTRGEVVGLNTLSIPELGQNLNFAVSAVDLRKVLDGAAAEPRPLVPGARKPQPGPGGGPGRGGRREIVDGLNTPVGQRLLAALPEISVAVILDSGDPLRTPREPRLSANLIASQCVQSLRTAGLRVVEQGGPDTAVLLVRAEFHKHMNTTFSCELDYTLLQRDAEPAGPMVRTWALQRDVTFDTRYMTQVKRLPGDVKTAIRMLAAAVRDARQHAGKPGPPAPSPPAPGVVPAPESISRPLPAGGPHPAPAD